MEIVLLVIGIGVVIYHLCKNAIDDAEVRDHARKNGMEWYASSTGLRRTDDNTKYYK
ncbi:MAG: hypothetical protein IJZ42_07165 [Lachnospiraceae bacterium]|nr:hypothetical protein [Lachnospiraceae bacterium]